METWEDALENLINFSQWNLKILDGDFLEVVREADDIICPYGSVYVVLNTLDGEYDLLKVVSPLKENCFPKEFLREIRFLPKIPNNASVHLKNIVKVKDDTGHICLGLHIEYFNWSFNYLSCTTDGAFFLEQGDNMKYIVRLMFQNLAEIHSQSFIHCNISPLNLVITEEGYVKLFDFQKAHLFDEHFDAVKENVLLAPSLYYLAPEILLGYGKISSSADCWSAGCTIAEMFLKKPLFDGEDVNTQLKKIETICGSVPEEVVCQNGLQEVLPMNEQNYILKEILGSYISDPLCIDMLTKLLDIDPKKRLRAAEALEHPYLDSQLEKKEKGSKSSH